MISIIASACSRVEGGVKDAYITLFSPECGHPARQNRPCQGHNIEQVNALLVETMGEEV